MLEALTRLAAISERRHLFKWLGLLGLGAASPSAWSAIWTRVTGGSGSGFNKGVSVRETREKWISPIAMGSNFSIVRRGDGTVWGCGANNLGQLGTGNVTSYSGVKQMLAISNAKAVAAGGAHALVLHGSGTISSVGSNSAGQLCISNFNPTSRSTITAVSGVSNVRAIAAGGTHSVVLEADGTLLAGGGNSRGQLAQNDTNNKNLASVVQANVASEVQMVAAGVEHTLWLRADGTVRGCGLNSSGQLGNGNTVNVSTSVQVTGISNANTISAGGYHSCVVISNGTVWTFGNNQYGQLGNGTTMSSSVPVQVSGASAIIAVAAGNHHTLALRGDGYVYAFGRNQAGQLGNANEDDQSLFVLVANLSNVVAIAAGGDASMALRSDGLVFAWGDNQSGQLGDGTVINKNVPTQFQL